MKKNTFRIKKIVYAAVFLAVALVLPFVTGQIPEMGQALCPMHLPVMLCGFLLGTPWGAAVGFIAPLLRMLIFGMPQMPMALAMMFELAAYGALCGLMHFVLPKKIPFIFLSLVTAMVGGRVVLAFVNFIISGFKGTEFSFFPYLLANVTTAIPGLILQIILIPMLVIVFEKLKILYFKK